MSVKLILECEFKGGEKNGKEWSMLKAAKNKLTIWPPKGELFHDGTTVSATVKFADAKPREYNGQTYNDIVLTLDDLHEVTPKKKPQEAAPPVQTEFVDVTGADDDLPF